MTATYNSEFDAVETEKSLIQRGVQTFGVHKITYNYNDNITPNMLEKENTPASFKSAVDWIIEEVNGFSWPAGYGTSLSIDISKETIDKAKEIEKNQLIRFAMAAYQNISRLKGVPENLISENKYLFEDYFQKWENEK
jgi:hypothetical protein